MLGLLKTSDSCVGEYSLGIRVATKRGVRYLSGHAHILLWADGAMHMLYLCVWADNVYYET